MVMEKLVELQCNLNPHTLLHCSDENLKSVKSGIRLDLKVTKSTTSRHVLVKRKVTQIT